MLLIKLGRARVRRQHQRARHFSKLIGQASLCIARWRCVHLGPALVVMGGHKLHQRLGFQCGKRVVAKRRGELAGQPGMVDLADDKARRA